MKLTEIITNWAESPGDFKKDSSEVRMMKKIAQDSGMPEWKLDSKKRFEVFGDVIVERYHMTGGKMPIKFGKVHGNFAISGGDKNVIRIRSAEGFPTEVAGDFTLNDTDITSMVNMPSKVGGHFKFTMSRITNLEHLPEVGKSIVLAGSSISSLRGMQPVINGNLDVSSIKLTSIAGIANYIKEIDGYIRLQAFNLMESPLLGLLQIDKLKGIVDAAPGTSGGLIDPSKYSSRQKLTGIDIVAKYVLQGDQDILGCQSELLDGINGDDWHSKSREKNAEL